MRKLILLLVLLVNPAWASFTFTTGQVVGCFATAGNNCSRGLTSVTAGHLLVLVVIWDGAPATLSISGTSSSWVALGSTGPLRGTGSLSAFMGQIWYLASAPSGTVTITATSSNTITFMNWQVQEYSYTGSSPIQDPTNAAAVYSNVTASGGSAAVSGLSATNSSDLIFTSCIAVDSACSAVATGYTQREAGGGEGYNARTGGWIADKSGSSGSQSATYTTGTTDNTMLFLGALTDSSLSGVVRHRAAVSQR